MIISHLRCFKNSLKNEDCKVILQQPGAQSTSSTFCLGNMKRCHGGDVERAQEVWVRVQALPPTLRPQFSHLYIRAKWDNLELDLFLLSNSVPFHLLAFVLCSVLTNLGVVAGE